MQCTIASYGKITWDFVHKVCDEPHPNKINEIFEHCTLRQTKEALEVIEELYNLGYSVDDLVGIMFRNAVNFSMFKF